MSTPSNETPLAAPPAFAGHVVAAPKGAPPPPPIPAGCIPNRPEPLPIPEEPVVQAPRWLHPEPTPPPPPPAAPAEASASASVVESKPGFKPPPPGLERVDEDAPMAYPAPPAKASAIASDPDLEAPGVDVVAGAVEVQFTDRRGPYIESIHRDRDPGMYQHFAEESRRMWREFTGDRATSYPVPSMHLMLSLPDNVVIPSTRDRDYVPPSNHAVLTRGNVREFNRQNQSTPLGAPAVLQPRTGAPTVAPAADAPTVAASSVVDSATVADDRGWDDWDPNDTASAANMGPPVTVATRAQDQPSSWQRPQRTYHQSQWRSNASRGGSWNQQSWNRQPWGSGGR